MGEEKQRAGRRARDASRTKRTWDWEPNVRLPYPLRPRSGRSGRSRPDSVDSSAMLTSCVEPGWRLRDILLAAGLLSGDNQGEDYEDEAEMRRVFGLVYDVLRCRL